jgi:hypothetical protein
MLQGFVKNRRVFHKKLSYSNFYELGGFTEIMKAAGLHAILQAGADNA